MVSYGCKSLDYKQTRLCSAIIVTPGSSTLQGKSGRLMVQINQGSSNTFGLAWVWKVCRSLLLGASLLRSVMCCVKAWTRC